MKRSATGFILSTLALIQHCRELREEASKPQDGQTLFYGESDNGGRPIPTEPEYTHRTELKSKILLFVLTPALLHPTDNFHHGPITNSAMPKRRPPFGFSASIRSIYAPHRDSNCSWWTQRVGMKKTRKSETVLIMDQQPMGVC